MPNVKKVQVQDTVSGNYSERPIGADAQNVEVGLLSGDIVDRVITGYKIGDKFYEQNDVTSTEIIGTDNTVYLDLNDNKAPYTYSSAGSAYVAVPAGQFNIDRLSTVLKDMSGTILEDVMTWEQQDTILGGTKNFLVCGEVPGDTEVVGDTGISYVINDDASITISGTATQDAIITVYFSQISSYDENLKFTIDFSQGSSTTVNGLAVNLLNASQTIIEPGFGNGSDGTAEISINKNSIPRALRIAVSSGANFTTPATIKPMLRYGSIVSRVYVPGALDNSNLTIDILKKQYKYDFSPSAWDTAPTENSTKPVTSGGVYQALQEVGSNDNFIGTVAEWNALTDAQKEQYKTVDFTDDFNGLGIDNTPTQNSENVVKSGGIYIEIQTLSNKHKVTLFQVSTSGWTTDTTSQSGSTLYKKSVALSHVYVDSPSVDIGAASGSVLPTKAQQTAYDLLQYVTLDGTTLYLYASAIPSDAFYINVEGVD